MRALGVVFFLGFALFAFAAALLLLSDGVYTLQNGIRATKNTTFGILQLLAAFLLNLPMFFSVLAFMLGGKDTHYFFLVFTRLWR